MRAGFVVVLVVALATAARADALICGTPRAQDHDPHLAPPPPTPQPRSMELETSAGRVTLRFEGPLDADTVLHVDLLRDPREPISIDLMPDPAQPRNSRACTIEVPALAIGEHVRVRMWAIDRWGATSDATTADTDISDYHHFHGCGMAFMGLFVIVGGVLLIGLVILFVVLVWKAATRARRIASAPSEPISLLVVERLARSLQFRAGLGFVLCAAAVGALVRTSPWEMFATAPLLVGLIDLHGYLTARGVLAALDHDARAELKYCQVLVHARGRTRRIEVSPRKLTAALREAVPRSTAS